jgi:hypothetical protein
MTAACASGVGSAIAGATRTGFSASSFRDTARRGGVVSRPRRGRRVPVAPRASLADFGVGDLGLGKSVQSSAGSLETAAFSAPSAAKGYAELFPDLPISVFGVSVPDSARALADAASPVTGAALDALPDDARLGVLGFWSDEVASGFTLVTGNAEYELFLLVLAFLWATGRPGVFAGAFDAYVAAPLDKVLLDKSFDVKNVKLGGRLGDGSFGQVFGATDTKTDADLVVKQAKSVQGAAQLQNAEEYMNRRVRRAPLAAIGCAKYLGSYDVVEGAASPSLVWAREGDVTLEDLINSRDYPGCLEEALYGDVSDSDDFAKRTNRAAKTVLRRLLFTLSQLHDIGVVHRDVKPANLVLADTESAFKLVDFGAAADLRTGYNYEPEQGLLDPFYSPPENFIMPERIPAPPPLRPIAASFSPLVWAAFLPDLFDSFSAGLVFLQMCVPQLRGRKVMDPNGAFRRNLEDANYDLRKWRKVVEPQGWDFSALDVGGGLGWDLACRLVCKRNALQRGRLGCNTALLHPFFWTP